MFHNFVHAVSNKIGEYLKFTIEINLRLDYLNGVEVNLKTKKFQ